MGRFISQRGIADIRHSLDVVNSVMKRTGRKGTVTAYTCGCGSPDCFGGATIINPKPPPEPKAKVPARPCHHFSGISV